MRTRGGLPRLCYRSSDCTRLPLATPFETKREKENKKKKKKQIGKHHTHQNKNQIFPQPSCSHHRKRIYQGAPKPPMPLKVAWGGDLPISAYCATYAWPSQQPPTQNQKNNETSKKNNEQKSPFLQEGARAVEKKNKRNRQNNKLKIVQGPAHGAGLALIP